MGERYRKYQCFVCGHKFSDYESYKNHILETNEAGREFVPCPACEAPVRDMISHYKVKHPNRLMPKDVQQRAVVWHDFSDSRRTTRKPNPKRGHYVSAKNKAEIFYRSDLERKVYDLLERDTEVVRYQAEPFKVPYNFQGKWHNYVPDLRVDFVDGTTEIWEVKPADQTDMERYPQNKAKWTAMKSHADTLGWHFTVLTEVGMGKLNHKIAQAAARLIQESA